MKSSTYINPCLAALLLFHTATAQTPKKQPVLGVRSVSLIKQDGLTFKDLNKNGRLDAYEDWRLPVETRSQDLLGRMSVDEKVGFMLISTTRLKNDWSFGAPQNKEPITSEFNE